MTDSAEFKLVLGKVMEMNKKFQSFDFEKNTASYKLLDFIYKSKIQTEKLRAHLDPNLRCTTGGKIIQLGKDFSFVYIYVDVRENYNLDIIVIVAFTILGNN